MGENLAGPPGPVLGSPVGNVARVLLVMEFAGVGTDTDTLTCLR